MDVTHSSSRPCVCTRLGTLLPATQFKGSDTNGCLRRCLSAGLCHQRSRSARFAGVRNAAAGTAPVRDGAEQYAQTSDQVMARLNAMYTPAQMTSYIKAQWQAAVRTMKAGPASESLSRYMDRMDQLCSGAAWQLNHLHISAILYGLAQVHMAARRRGSTGQPSSWLDMPAFASRRLAELQQLTPACSCREVSSILWSFARLRLNPETLLPGIVTSLAQRFLEDINSATGQSYASLLLACSDLRLNLSRGDVLQSIVQHLSQCTDLGRFSAQAIANITYSLAVLPSVKPSAQLLDALCHAFLKRLQSYPEGQRPQPQAVANVAWALQALKHVPPSAVSAAMLVRMLHVCNNAGQPPQPQAVSNFLFACSELRVAITREQLEVLTAQLLDTPAANTQDLTNAVWAAAVLGLLQPKMLKQVLDTLHALPAKAAPPTTANLAQLYRALDWLEASASNQQHSAEWSKLQADLQRLSARPEKYERKTRGTLEMSAALTELGLSHSPLVAVKGHWMHAVVHSQDPTAKPIFVAGVAKPDCFANRPDRLTGRAMFRRKLLSQEGSLIEVPLVVAEQGVDHLVDHLKPKLEAAAGGSLEAYRV